MGYYGAVSEKIPLGLNKIDKISDYIVRHASTNWQSKMPEGELSKPVYSYLYHVLLLYVLDPIADTDYFKLVEAIDVDKSKEVRQSAQVIISVLETEKKIEIQNKVIRTLKGKVEEYVGAYINDVKGKKIMRVVSDARLEVLNLRLRRNGGYS